MQPRFHPNYSYLLGVLEVSPEIETKRKVVVNSDCAFRGRVEDHTAAEKTD